MVEDNAQSKTDESTRATGGQTKALGGPRRDKMIRGPHVKKEAGNSEN